METGDTRFFNPGPPLPIPPNVARVVLRAYFIGAFAVVNYVASKALRATARRQFVDHDEIHVAHLTGWMSGYEIFTTAWKMRKPPGGRAATILMIFFLVLSKALDLTINGLVDSGPLRHTTCAFNEGLVVSVNGPYFQDRPPQNWEPFNLAWNAQSISISNSGSKGIYKKVDINPSFSAIADLHSYSDILTSWNCSAGIPDLTFTAYSTTEQIIGNMTRDGFLYDNQRSIERNSTVPPNRLLGSTFAFENFVVWTSSVEDGAGSPFSVKAAVQVTPRHSNNGSVIASLPIIMRPVSCSLDNSSTVETLASSLATVSTLWDWVLQFQGFMYTGTGTRIVDDAPDLLSRYLNSMFMVQGSNNALSSTLLPEDQERKEGCVASSTTIPIFVIVLVPFVFLAIIAMILWWLITELRIGFHRERRDKAKSLPYDATDWMLQAMREHDMSSQAEEVVKYNARDISKWRFVAGGGHEPSHLGHLKEDVLSVTVFPKHEIRHWGLGNHLNPHTLKERLPHWRPD